MKALLSVEVALGAALDFPVAALPLLVAFSLSCGAAENAASESKAASKVSYYHDVRPILQANCQGCHQPAKNKGGYVMTDFKHLFLVRTRVGLLATRHYNFGGCRHCFKLGSRAQVRLVGTFSKFAY